MKKLSKRAKAMKKGLAVLLAVVLMMSAVPASVVQASVPEIPAETGELPEGGPVPEAPAEGDDGQQSGEGEETPSPDDGTTQTPGEGDGQKPDDGTTQTPVEGDGQKPDDGTTQTPVEGDGQKPDDGTTQTPVEGDGQKPDDGTTQTPVEGDGQKPDDGTQKPTDTKPVIGPDGTILTPGADLLKPNQAPVVEEETEKEETEVEVTDEVFFNTGNHVWQIVNEEAFNEGEIGDGCFEEDGSYTIYIPEPNPLFPYEVQFIYEDEVTNHWFMSPDDSVEIGGHSFYVTADFDDSAVIQMSLNVGGDTILIYPEEKEFTDDGDGASTYSLQPLEERRLSGIDLTAYTPAELTMVSVDYLFKNGEAQNAENVVWTYNAYEEEGEFTVSAAGDKLDLSWGTSSTSFPMWQIIVGSADQLDTSNIRYIVMIHVKSSGSWLSSTGFMKDTAGNKIEALTASTPLYSDSWYNRDDSGRRLSMYLNFSQSVDNEQEYYVTLALNDSVFPDVQFSSRKVFEGQFTSADEAVKGTDITDALCNSGYVMKEYQGKWVTMVTYDNAGNVTGCLPFQLFLSVGQRDRVSPGGLIERDGTNWANVGGYSSKTVDGCKYYTYRLTGGYSIDSEYYLYMTCLEAGQNNPSAITAAYVGQYDSIAQAEAAQAPEIKKELFDNSYTAGGYGADYSKGVYFTVFIGNDGAGQETYHFQVKTEMYPNRVSLNGMVKKDETGWSYVSSTYSHESEGDCDKYTYPIYEENPVNGTYYLSMSYYQAAQRNSAAVTAAYVGRYDSIAQATAAGTADIKKDLFSDNDYTTGGYAADYSQGVYFTIFVGADGAGQEIYHLYVNTEIRPRIPNGQTDVRFIGLKDENEEDINVYIVDNNNDSYADNNYHTILVENTVDLTKLAPVFNMASGINLYAENVLQISGKSYHDFSNGAIQYSASAENKEDARNYWLQVVPVNSGKRLYIDSLSDENSNTWTDNSGIIHSTREMLLDDYHDYRHDILLINAGTEDIENLDVELVSDNVVLDEYWTLHGEHKLSAVTTVNKTDGVNYGELSNLAKLRLKAKDGIKAGTDVSGTLTIKSGSDVLMILTLTGTVGNPCIITKEIPQAVKYVPYGVMIQNNNKYSWNKTSYRLQSGTLPAGMSVMPNGELYGVPMETGEFTFTVRMTNSSSYFSNSEKTYTLVVVENTDANVDAATDSGYDITQRVQGSAVSESGSQTLVSQGQYSEFEYVYLDGVKLEEGTDYTSEEGSTRITIRNQTLAGSDGTHTIGVEFRMKDEDNELRRAAQNYTIQSVVTPDNPDNNTPDNDDSDSGGSSSDSSDSESSTGDSSSGTGSSQTTGTGVNGQNRNGLNSNTQTPAAVNAEAPITYTIQAGDTLWKIAEKYYGSGTFWKKIYTDNAEVIQDPDKIYVGQTIMLYPIQGTIAAPGTMTTTEGSYYTVESGDTLWKIAQKVYGKGWQWRKIYQANKDQISEPGNIFVGQVIFIPD